MKPAIFNTDMVRAIIALLKTNTRRPFSKYIKKVIKYAYELGEIGSNGVDTPFSDGDIKYLLDFAPYKKGDIIYVRETWSDYPQYYIWYKADFPIHYEAEETQHGDVVHIEADEIKWKPSIHMPKEYARLFLRVKDVRIERLNEISEEDARAEGATWTNNGARSWLNSGICFEEADKINGWKEGWSHEGETHPDRCLSSAKWSFAHLWESIYGKGSFNDDYVWVIEFEKISKEEAINDKP